MKTTGKSNQTLDRSKMKKKKKNNKKKKKKKEKNKVDYVLTEDDFKRQSALTRLKFARFNLLSQFDTERKINSYNGVDESHLMSREDFVDHILENTRDFDVLKKVEEDESSNKERNLSDLGKVEARKMKKNKKKKLKKLKKEYDASFDRFADKDYEFQTIDPDDPKVQSELDDKFKLVEARFNLLQDIRRTQGPVAAAAKAKAIVEGAPLLICN